MRFQIVFEFSFENIFYKTPLCIAAEKENIELIQILLTQPDIDVNVKSILTFVLIQFTIKVLHEILNYKFKSNFKIFFINRVFN